jgi:hypothetical protein
MGTIVAVITGVTGPVLDNCIHPVEKIPMTMKNIRKIG